jgi:hypothetical protein
VVRIACTRGGRFVSNRVSWAGANPVLFQHHSEFAADVHAFLADAG